ncbi:MAG: type II toxin-antitoxin system HicB family antitoxin [Armatimonadetes bacterium]|nr:type II toxin-antitoxin system HicB family antitoxin [Armatimonadota bacterium]
MFTEYVQAAMKHAHYEIMENGRYYGHIPALQGVWADGDTLEECRETLREVIEGWLIVGFRHGDPVPVIDGIDLNEQVETEAASVKA